MATRWNQPKRWEPSLYAVGTGAQRAIVIGTLSQTWFYCPRAEILIY